MPKLIKLPCDNNSDILVEVDPLPGEMVEVGLEETIEKVTRSFTNLSQTIVNACKSFVNIINQVEEEARPDEMQIEFGIKLGAEGSVFVVKTSGEANFSISLSWKNSPRQKAE